MIKTLQHTIVAAVLGLATIVATADDSITIGGKDFTEQFILAQMTKQLLENNGFNVDVRDGMGSTVLRRAQVNGQIDLYWEYTGTSLLVYNKESASNRTPQETYDLVKKLDRKKGLIWLHPSDANNTYALAVDEGQSSTEGINSISDLAHAYRQGEDLTIAHDAEFSEREDGLPGLTEAYDFEVPRADSQVISEGLQYNALENRKADVAVVYATDGRIAAFDFRVLTDNRNFFPNYALVPVVRKKVLNQYPRLRKLMNDLSRRLDDATMQKLNKKVDIDQQSEETVAREFLENQGFL